MLKNYLKIALRNIKNQKVYSFINISGLAIGMACTILILLWVQDELSYDTFHKNADEIYRVAFTNEKQDFHAPYVPGALAEFLRDEYPEIIYSTRYSGEREWKLTHDEKSFLSKGRYVDPSFFKMFTFPFVKGNPEKAFSDPYSIVITEDLANKFFGNNDPIGRTIKLYDEDDVKVTGIIKTIPLNSHMKFDFLVPVEIDSSWMNRWDIKTVTNYILLQKNSSPLEINKKISEVLNNHNPTWKNFLYLQPLKEIHLYSLGGGGHITYIYIFSVMGLVILLITCINFINLSTARSEKRFKEVGIKKVLGSNRMQLIKQFLSESILLSCVSLFLAIVLVQLFLPTINNLLSKQIELDYSGTIIWSIIVIIFISGIIAGSYPAFYLSSFHPVAVLKGQLSLTSVTNKRRESFTAKYLGGSSLRRILVIAQFAFSIFFIICVSVIFNQLTYIKNKDMGFDKEHIIVLPTRGEIYQKSQDVKNELLTNPNIIGVTVTASSLVKWQSSFGVEWPGKQPDENFDIGLNRVDYDYLKTFQMEMAQGRFFSKNFSTDASDAFIINEAAVKAMGMENPVGKKITIAPSQSYEQKGTIIGVIKDYHTESLHERIKPFILQLNTGGGFLCIKLKSNKIAESLNYIISVRLN